VSVCRLSRQICKEQTFHSCRSSTYYCLLSDTAHLLDTTNQATSCSVRISGIGIGIFLLLFLSIHTIIRCTTLLLPSLNLCTMRLPLSTSVQTSCTSHLCTARLLSSRDGPSPLARDRTCSTYPASSHSCDVIYLESNRNKTSVSH
jgi:hypothetical protein